MKINKKKLIPILIAAAGVFIAIFAGNNERGNKFTGVLNTVGGFLGVEGASGGASPLTGVLNTVGGFLGAEGASNGSSPLTDAPNTAGGISGTYVFVSDSDEAAVTYSGNNFMLTVNGRELGRGSFMVQENSVIHNDKPFFTIVDANTLRDPDGDLWRKSGTAGSSTPRASGNTGTGDIFDQMMRESDKNRAEKREVWDSETRDEVRRSAERDRQLRIANNEDTR